MYDKSKLTPKNEPKDRIEIEIGDFKQPEFIPQVKLMRWDNEVNVSIRQQSEGTPNFYEVDEGYEFEVILTEKPVSNKVRFTINHKELNFYYQPELTQEEIDEGAVRPDEVVGSYAVYHKSKGGMNRADGMEYKAGKAFHIYRPYAQDANGMGVWCDLKITGGYLNITIPQDFLDQAAYPVIVDPTFGYTSIGGSGNGTQLDADRIWGADDTGATGHHDAPEDGNVSSITFYTGGSDAIRPVLYDADDSFALVTYGDEITTSVGADWNNMSVTSAPITSGTRYPMCFWTGTDNVLYYYDSVTDDDVRGDSFTYHSTNAPADPAAFTSTIADRRMSIYATYTASGGGTTEDKSFMTTNKFWGG